MNDRAVYLLTAGVALAFAWRFLSWKNPKPVLSSRTRALEWSPIRRLRSSPN